MDLKALFNGGALTYEQFEAAVKEAKLNIVNLAEGGYVSQAKFDDKINDLNRQVTALNEQISQRDSDMATLKTSLEAAQADAGKLPNVQQSLTELQQKYAHDKAEYENSMARQRYEFAVREKANGLKFSSAAAKKAFVEEAISKEFKQDGDTLLGYEDFVTKYKATDPGAFVQETTPAPAPTPKVTLPGHDKPPANRRSLSELMQMKNSNPDMDVNF